MSLIDPFRLLSRAINQYPTYDDIHFNAARHWLVTHIYLDARDLPSEAIIKIFIRAGL